MRARPYRLGLRGRLLLIVALAIIPALGLIVAEAAEARHRLAEAAIEDAERAVDAAVVHQRQLIDGARELLPGLAQVEVIREGDDAACSATLRGLLDRYPQYTTFVRIGRDGHINCSALDQADGVYVGDRLYFRRAAESGNFSVGDYQIGRITGKPTIGFAYPIVDDRGEFNGTLTAALDLTWFSTTVRKVTLPEGAVMGVVDPNGHELARHPHVGTTGSNISQVPIIREMLERRHGTAESSGRDGVMRFYAFRPVPGSDGNDLAYVGMGIPVTTVYAAANREFAQDLVLGAVVGILAVGLVWLTTDRYVLRPVEGLVAATRRVGGGDLAARAPTGKGGAEVEELAASFNEMAESLERQVGREVAARAELEHANKELAAFSYSVSHDLRAPLRAIDGFSQSLLEEQAARLDPRGRSDLERVRVAAQRMGRLIDDLLSLSRLNQATLRRERVDLSAIARGVADRLTAAEPERDATFAIADGATATGDPRLLEIVLDNLLRNAWKFTSHKPGARIEFGTTRHEGRRAFLVRDDGAGFDPAYTHKLFTPFQRLHAADEFEGTGIGLATVQRIVHRHGGHAWAEGSPGRGATFYFTLDAGDADGGRRDGRTGGPEANR